MHVSLPLARSCCVMPLDSLNSLGVSLGYLSWLTGTAIYSHLQPFTAIYSHLQPFTANHSHLQQSKWASTVLEHTEMAWYFLVLLLGGGAKSEIAVIAVSAGAGPGPGLALGGGRGMRGERRAGRTYCTLHTCMYIKQT